MSGSRGVRSRVTGPIYNYGAPRPQCSTSGCIHDAVFITIYGCLDGHTCEANYCNPCIAAKRERVKENLIAMANDMEKYAILLRCNERHPVTDLLWVSINDPFRSVYDIFGAKIHDD